MSLRALLQNAASIAFAAAGDIPVDVTIKSGPTQAHNSVTDVTTTTWTHSDPVKAISFDEGQAEDKDGKSETRGGGPNKREKKLLVKAADLSTVPTEQSIATMTDGDWEVTNVEPDPALATYTITVRR